MSETNFYFLYLLFHYWTDCKLTSNNFIMENYGCIVVFETHYILLRIIQTFINQVWASHKNVIGITIKAKAKYPQHLLKPADTHFLFK